MFKYIVMQKLRSAKKALKVYYGVFLGGIIFFIIFAPWVYEILSAVNLSEYVSQSSIGIVFLSSVCIFFRKRALSFKMHPATFHFSFNTMRFKQIKNLSIIISIFNFLIISFLLYVIIFLSLFPVFKVFYYLIISTFLITCLLINWVKYNSRSISGMTIVINEFLIASILFYVTMVTSSPVLIVLQLLLLILIILHNHLQLNDWGNYLKDNSYNALINYASRNRDIALMTQITVEHNSEKKRFIQLNQLTLKENNSLFSFIMITTMRVNKIYFVLLSLLIIFCICIGNLEKPLIDIQVNFLETIRLNSILAMFLLNIALCNIKEGFCERLVSILDKCRSGLFLPYSNIVIIRNFLYVSGIILTSILLLIAFFTQSNILMALAVILSVNIVMLISLCFSCRVMRRSWLFRILSDLILLVTCFLLFI